MKQTVFHLRVDRRADSHDALRSTAWLESIQWKKPGILTVKICRYTLNLNDWQIASEAIKRIVDSEILGERESVEFEELSGYWKVTLTFIKGSEHRFVDGQDNNKYNVRAILFRDSIFNHIFKDKIVAKYQGFVDPVTQQVYFPKTIDKNRLGKAAGGGSKNPHGRPWTGWNWPLLGGEYPEGHIRNPYHGVAFFLQPSVEFTVETIHVGGSLSWNRFTKELGFGDRPPLYGFAFLGRNAQAVDRVMEGGKPGRVKPQYRWIVSDLNITKIGKEKKVRQSWRSKADPGWPIPIYKRNWTPGNATR